jgi:hypothetical protein
MNRFLSWRRIEPAWWLGQSLAQAGVAPRTCAAAKRCPGGDAVNRLRRGWSELRRDPGRVPGALAARVENLFLRGERHAKTPCADGYCQLAVTGLAADFGRPSRV